MIQSIINIYYVTVTDTKGYNQGGSSLKDRLGEMKVKFKLKNQK